MALFQPQSAGVLAPSGRGNDNGFVFRRGRNVAALSSKAARLLAAATLAAGRHSENQRPPANAAAAATPPAKKRPLAPQPAGSRLDFPEPKRRLTQRADERPADISVPVQRPPQPTPLKPRTRTPMLAGTAPAAAAGRPVGRRKSTLGGRRRSTFSMRGKRASSIGGGFKAVPHASVGSSDFFRHISPELPEPVRLRQLLAWCARRAPPPSAAWPSGLPAGVQKLLGDALREATDDMHSAFEKEAIVTSWYHRPVDADEHEQRPMGAHPENEANARAREALQVRIDALRAEERAWVDELKRASAAHARCLDRLPRPVRDLSARPADGCLAEPLLARGAGAADWHAALASDGSAADPGLLAYAESRAAIDTEVLAADRDVARALDDLQVLLDAFHLDVHRAGQKHVRAAERSQRVAADLGFALAQRRARAAAVPGLADPAMVPQKHQAGGGHDPTRDLLRTLAAATARRS
ncbi:hypothetical protein GGI15_003418 [Coemansia interrupta]|uniref:Uncharacterized protein n=1 Tax=Coemansia interrupta TaxID=1126814 RepID=A0A9W8HF95_9FUNG|nr:hypothetical protein GGI15_003418 [Coemansia interrupta]